MALINECCLAGLHVRPSALTTPVVSVTEIRRIADGENFLADLQSVRISERQRDEVLSFGSTFTSATSLRWSAPMNFADNAIDRQAPLRWTARLRRRGN